MKMKILPLSFVLLSLFFWSCSKDKDDNDLDDLVFVDIHEYAAKHFPEADRTETGMYVIIEEEGNGAYPEPDERLFVYFTLHLLDGKVIDTLNYRRKPDWYVQPLKPMHPGSGATEAQLEAYEKSLEEYEKELSDYNNLSTKFKLFTFKYDTNDVIVGFNEGVGRMKKGSKAVLLIPAKLAYGEKSYGNIPANASLRYDIELVNVK